MRYGGRSAAADAIFSIANRTGKRHLSRPLARLNPAMPGEMHNPPISFIQPIPIRSERLLLNGPKSWRSQLRRKNLSIHGTGYAFAAGRLVASAAEVDLPVPDAAQPIN